MALNRKEWQDFYGFTDGEMDYIAEAVKLFNGKIIAVKEIKH